MAYKNNKDVQITFANYNYAFELYFSYYKKVCLSIIESKNLLENINEVDLFIYEYDYAVPDIEKRNMFHTKLRGLREKIEREDVLKQMNANKDRGAYQRVVNVKMYFKYLVEILDLLSEFVSELTSSFMPRTTLQKKQIQYSTNELFFKKFSEVKKIVNERLSTFKLIGFIEAYKPFLVYYYAYRLYVDEGRKETISKLLSLALSYYCHTSIVGVLRKHPNYSESDKEVYRSSTLYVMGCMSLSNSILNQSFSNYGVLPKIVKKELIDKTGI